MNTIAAILIAYLLGSIPTAFWIAKFWKKIDIREHGSKNAGLTNTVRVLGWKPAFPVIMVDLGKGLAAPMIGMLLVPGSDYVPLLAGLAVILGHSFTCFAGFRGGKGVLTGVGVFLTLSPLAAIIGFTAWALVVKVSGYVSLGSIVGCLTLVAMLTLGIFYPNEWIGKVHPSLWALGVALATFVIYKHKSNIRRLLNGTENGFKKKDSQ